MAWRLAVQPDRDAWARLGHPKAWTPATNAGMTHQRSWGMISLRHPDRREILEPVLRLNETLHLWADGARVHVMGHHQEQCVVDVFLVHLLQQLGLLRRIEGVADPAEQFIHFGVAVVTPVGAGRSGKVTFDVSDEGQEGVLDTVGKVYRGGTVSVVVLGARAPDIDESVPF